MSENLPPYEENNQFPFDNTDLPVPDMESSWGKMNKLLDEEKTKPSLFQNVLKGSIIALAFITAAIFLWLLLPQKSAIDNKGNSTVNIDKNAFKSNNHMQGKSRSTLVEVGKENPAATRLDTNTVITGKGNIGFSRDKSVKHLEHKNFKKADLNYFASNKRDEKIRHFREGDFSTRQRVVRDKQVGLANASRSKGKQKVVREASTTNSSRNNNNNPGETYTEETSNSITTVNDSSLSYHYDSTTEVTGKKLLSLQQQPAKDSGQVITKVENIKPKEHERHGFYFGAGLALQQQIALSGQKPVAYNYYGRTGSLADYIPSVYVRLYKQKKWFLQSEFRYGAPQYTKQFNYNEAKVDSFGASVTKRYTQLKKTYYHQIPISFNYFVLPNLTIGAGIMYSRFYGAVSEEELRNTNLITGKDSIISKAVIQVPGKSDSFFTKSQLHVLLEAQYQWRRFSLGFRYTQGLQPYIKYTTATGEQKSEKNHSLQAFIRYELWQSKKKK